MSEVVEKGLVYRKKITAEVFAPYPTVAPKEIKWLGVIYGDLRGIEAGMSAYGSFVRLTGEFIAENGETGLKVTATSAILPSIAEQVLMQYLQNLGIDQAKIGERLDTGRVSFGMEIGIEGRVRKGDNDTTAGYQWVIKPTAALARSPIAMLRDQFWSAPEAALAAPADVNLDTGEVAQDVRKVSKKA